MDLLACVGAQCVEARQDGNMLGFKFQALYNTPQQLHHGY